MYVVFSSDLHISLLMQRKGPGSFIEVTKIIEPLVAPESPDAPAFHVVVYGLAGFGFSEAPKKKGFGIAQHAEVPRNSLSSEICLLTHDRRHINSCWLSDTMSTVRMSHYACKARL
jgi:hypothetical protein